MPRVLESFARLKSEADIVLVEGAGSASEINLRAGTTSPIWALPAPPDVPVVLVGDIDRGGVIASLVGTKAVLDADDAELVAGFIVNRMRGDPTLFADGMTAIARRTGWPALGLVPFFDGARRLPAEDAFDLAETPDAARGTGGRSDRRAAAAAHRQFRRSRSAGAEPDVDLVMVRARRRRCPSCDLVILPGSKATIADLAALRAEGWDIDIAAHVRRGGRVLGLCGGYQMLGRTHRRPATASRARRRRCRGSACSTSRPRSTGDKPLAEVSGEIDRRRRGRSAATRCIWA